MSRTLQDLIKAGALSQLCRYHHKLGGSDDDWQRVSDFAYREFREIDTATIDRLIAKAKDARRAARLLGACSRNVALRPIDIPTMD